MAFTEQLRSIVLASLESLYGQSFREEDFQINETKAEFEGDYTIVLFALVKKLKISPEELAKSLGEAMLAHGRGFIEKYNIIKAFVNLTLSDQALNGFLDHNYQDSRYGRVPAPRLKRIMVEYSSPNTNKPLHLGHLRNNFLGWSVAEILKAKGHEVIKSSIINDRGIHICKSMIAWQEYSKGATPQSTHQKGDHFVGDYYVRFNEVYNKQVKDMVENGIPEKQAEREAPIMKKTQQMLVDWEKGTPEVRALWEKMNHWVYEGFEQTYQRIGCDFDKTFYESQTYLLGKDFVQQGLKQGLLFKKEDGSVWINLNDSALDEKLLLRGDGTSVYITQDIGLARQKFSDYHLDESIYVIGDEQIHHMKVLREICRKLGMPFADQIHHLSYGMVELTTGRMKSREGTVVDADDLIDEMIDTARLHTEQLGKVKDFTKSELEQLYETLGLGAMKFYLLRVDPKKRMVFNPEDSIDFHGFTGPFIQYTYARIRSILRKLSEEGGSQHASDPIHPLSRERLLPLERQVLLSLEKYPDAISEAAAQLDPSVIANYAYALAKNFNSFYTEHSVFHAENEVKKSLRVKLALMTSLVIESALQLLGIRVPERM